MLFQKIDCINHEGELLKDHYLITHGDKITYLSEQAPPPDLAGQDTIYQGQNKVLAPGFYNLHNHIPMTILRGYGEGLNLHDWLFQKIFPFEALLTADDIYWSSLLGIAELLASGTVAFSDMYSELTSIAKAALESGIKANIAAGCIGLDNTKFKESKAYREHLDLAQLVKGNERVKAELALHAEYTSNPSLVRELASFAQAENLAIQVHLSETEKENKDCYQRHGKSPTQYFSELGLFDSHCIADHCVHLKEEDMEILAKKQVFACHCPSSNLKLGSGFAPITKWLDAGIEVVLGTDGAASNNNLNLIEEMHLAALLQKGLNQDAQSLDNKTLIKMLSQNGARAQRRKLAGRLEAGAKADLIIFDFDQAHLQPVYDPLANLIYSAQAQDVVLTMVDGKVLYKDGEFLSLDLARIKYEVKRIQKEKLAQL